MFGQTCACTGCGGFFTIPAPLENEGPGQGLEHGQGDRREAVASLLADKEILSEEADRLRERLSLKNREVSEMVIGRAALIERAEASAKAQKQLETDLAESQKELTALRAEVKAGRAALNIAVEAGREAAKSLNLLEQKQRDAEVLEQRLNSSVQRIEVLSAECAQVAEELDVEKARNKASQTEVLTLQEGREVLLNELKEANLQCVQSVLRLTELEKEVRTLSAKIVELSGAEEGRKNSQIKLREAEQEIAEFSVKEKNWREMAQQNERSLQESRAEVTELKSAIVRANADCEVLRMEVQKWQTSVDQTRSSLDRRVESDKHSDRLREQIGDLETRLRDSSEKQIELVRQLAQKEEELAVMHHRLLQSDHGDRSVPHFSGVFSNLSKRLNTVLLMVERWLGCVFTGFESWKRSLRLAASATVWSVLVASLTWAGFLSVGAMRGARRYEPARSPSDLVHAMPVLREIHEEVSNGNSTETIVPVAATAPLELGDANLQASSPGSASGGVAESAAPKLEQVVKSAVESEPMEVPKGVGSADLAVSKATVPVVIETHEGKEPMKNLSRASLPNQFLGTQFGTALSDVTNLAHWTESNGRLRRKATLVGEAVEAVLIPDHENRVMAGAYVRVCPRSTESLAPFLEWAVGVQDAVDAEYGEPSTVHEVGEAEDAAAVVERIANGKDFYEAIWERQSDDGFIVLSIRVFNERSVVFRLEYLNRQLLSEYTAQQRNAAQAEPAVSPEN